MKSAFPYSSFDPHTEPRSVLWKLADDKGIENPRETIGMAITKWRFNKIEINISQIAKKINVPDEDWIRWEQGQALPSDEALVRLEDELNYTPEQIIKDAQKISRGLIKSKNIEEDSEFQEPVSPYSSYDEFNNPESNLWSLSIEYGIDEPLKFIGMALKEWRERHKESSVPAMSQKTGIPIEDWMDWENEKSLPSNDALRVLSKFKLQPDDLLQKAKAFSRNHNSLNEQVDDSEAESESPNSRTKSILWEKGFSPDIAGKVILDIRKKMDLTQNQFAKALDISASAVSNWETGKTNPSDWSLNQIRKNFKHEGENFLQSCSEVQKILRNQQEYSVGRMGGFGRNTNKSGLNAQQYANAISRLFRLAKDDFCFGLFGPWGRGKTHLMKLVEEELGKDCEALPASAGSLKYSTVWFSAWKYRTTPEVWVHLYETLSDACYGVDWKKRIPRQIRTNVHRQGYSKLILSILSVTLIMGSFVNLHSEILMPLLTASGVGGFLFLCNLIFQARKSQKQLFSEYTKVTSHKEKLGLQALIGDDLRALILGWIPQKIDIEKPIRHILKKQKWHSIFFIAACLTIVVPILLYLDVFRIEPWSENFYYSIGFSIILTLCWFVILRIIVSWVLLGGRNSDKILLIIDDLDRCEMDQVLEIVECIILVLEEEEFRERIQLCFLVEDTVLKKAIATKIRKYHRRKKKFTFIGRARL